MRMLVTALLIGMIVLGARPVSGQAPPGYPRNYNELIAAANREARLVIYSTTDIAVAQPLLADFRALYPDIAVQYVEATSGELYNRYLAEVGGASADILWSSAMDLQVKLANDGHALPYRSPEIPHLPQWAVMRHDAFGTTFEPAVFIYNKRLLPPEAVPQSHTELVRLLRENPERFRGRLGTYDPDRSALGFMFFTHDSKHFPAFWTLVRLFGANRVELHTSTAAIMERIASGKLLLGYNMLGSYAARRASADPSLGVVLPKDYTLVLSRIAFISRHARNPSAAKLWIDYILSRRGQEIIANKSKLFSIRPDVMGETTAAQLSQTLGASLQPIAVGPRLLVYLDRVKRERFLSQWHQMLEQPHLAARIERD